MSGQSFSGLCCPTLVANQLAVFLKDLQQLCCASKRPPPNHTIPPNLWHPSLSFPSQYPDTYLITLSWRNQIEAAQQMLSELLSKCNKKTHSLQYWRKQTFVQKRRWEDNAHSPSGTSVKDGNLLNLFRDSNQNHWLMTLTLWITTGF